MIGAAIFIVFFLGFLAITLGVPVIPPGSLTHALLGIPETGYLVFGIPAWLLINAVVNGVVYGFIVWLIYTLLSKPPSRGTTQIPPVQHEVAVHVQETREKKVTDYIKMAERTRPIYEMRLLNAGIKTTDHLLDRGSTRRGREELARTTGIPYKLILKWVNLSDLFRITGIGREYSDLLEEAGVNTVVELSKRNSEKLYAKILEINEQKVLVKKPPSLNEVINWIKQAKNLPRKIEY